MLGTISLQLRMCSTKLWLPSLFDSLSLAPVLRRAASGTFSIPSCHFHTRRDRLVRKLVAKGGRSMCGVPKSVVSEDQVVGPAHHVLDEGEGYSLGEAAKFDTSSERRMDLQVVLVSPQIPGNTGCIARTCAAAAVGLHLIEPLGFEISSAKLKRAGLDYWPGDKRRYVVVKVHKSWLEFFEYFQRQEGEKRLLAFTKKGSYTHSDMEYRAGDWLLFGSETDGLPDAALNESQQGPYAGGTVRIPVDETYVRCLNLSVAAGIGLYEALRQIGYTQNMLDTTRRQRTGSDVTEDIFC